MMELYGEILQNLLAGHRVEVTFPDLTVRPEDLLTSVCYRALVQIREILRDGAYTNEECFFKIAEIIQHLEQPDSDGVSSWKHQ